jgi:protein-S-isoprenylcysteine O-methyltransferase Ste14
MERGSWPEQPRETVLMILAVPVFALIHSDVVLREEHYHSGKFGAPNEAHRRRVRRYL